MIRLPMNNNCSNYESFTHADGAYYYVINQARLMKPFVMVVPLKEPSVTTRFSNDVDQQLVLASRILSCEEWKKYVILMDEM